MFRPPQQKAPERLSTDAQFWLYLTPFLLGAVATWGYLVSWIFSKAPTLLMGVVSFFSTGS
ncbi:MAG: hypothetical protein WA970_14375 [Gammaproteobacteria bacterium]|jgi:hypothetical protein